MIRTRVDREQIAYFVSSECVHTEGTIELGVRCACLDYYNNKMTRFATLGAGRRVREEAITVLS